MKYLIWVFQSFGFKAGVHYCWDMCSLWVRRKLGMAPPPVDFTGLSFDDLEDIKDSLNGTHNRTLH